MWQGYKRRPDSYRKREVAPYVSINRRGEIVLNEAAMRLAYASWEITLFYDAETNRLGIRGGAAAILRCMSSGRVVTAAAGVCAWCVQAAC